MYSSVRVCIRNTLPRVTSFNFYVANFSRPILLSCLRRSWSRHISEYYLCSLPITTRFVPPYNSITANIATTADTESNHLDLNTFEKFSDETLESLTEYIEELIDGASHLNSADVSYSTGVLTVKFGSKYGTYVINRQSPNRQIWLSSPTSGPKRYDYCSQSNKWIYRHDGRSLHELLQEEIPGIVGTKVNFGKCVHSGKN